MGDGRHRERPPRRSGQPSRFAEIKTDGTPSFRARIEPGEHWSGSMSTALPLLNAIPAVCAAPPGIVNYGELPLVRGAHAKH